MCPTSPWLPQYRRGMMTGPLAWEPKACGNPQHRGIERRNLKPGHEPPRSRKVSPSSAVVQDLLKAVMQSGIKSGSQVDALVGNHTIDRHRLVVYPLETSTRGAGFPASISARSRLRHASPTTKPPLTRMTRMIS